jgi:hypothetical protein
MPRTAKRTLSGAPAQPVQAVEGQAYGNGVKQEQMQQLMPLPNQQGTPAAAPPATQAAPNPVQDAPMTHEQLLAIAAQMKGQAGTLLPETTRPDEPVTAGLVSGPGPGPEALALRRGSPTGDMLRQLTEQTGDPLFAEIAAKAKA